MARVMESTPDPCTLKLSNEGSNINYSTLQITQGYQLLACESYPQICPLTGKARHESFLQAVHILMNANMSANIMKIVSPTEPFDVI